MTSKQYYAKALWFRFKKVAKKAVQRFAFINRKTKY